MTPETKRRREAPETPVATTTAMPAGIKDFGLKSLLKKGMAMAGQTPRAESA
ncbi:hypothetical protein Ahu01nite_060480 [Winogradskya humida]|uniref:Uncharacterized protein n=1 Tax=Winogradskya humida TaxID=113566 RepID=A0ABQ3ZWJ9_9ACTN|nr:hypothetical protein Ahu01nite_060480 [Actinoplanes humidus]